MVQNSNFKILFIRLTKEISRRAVIIVKTEVNRKALILIRPGEEGGANMPTGYQNEFITLELNVGFTSNQALCLSYFVV